MAKKRGFVLIYEQLSTIRTYKTYFSAGTNSNKAEKGLLLT
jgi:hypothetical protein